MRTEQTSDGMNNQPDNRDKSDERTEEKNRQREKQEKSYGVLTEKETNRIWSSFSAQTSSEPVEAASFAETAETTTAFEEILPQLIATHIAVVNAGDVPKVMVIAHMFFQIRTTSTSFSLQKVTFIRVRASALLPLLLTYKAEFMLAETSVDR